jgi:3',5'-cyclic AMP phosphodiesterase CpdA
MRSIQKMNRRRLLRLGVGSLLSAGVWPGALWAENSAPGGDFHFAVINDLHYHDAGCRPWFDALVKHLKDRLEGIDFCLLAGDLADRGKPEQLAGVRDSFKQFGRPVHVVIGNHDYLTMTDRKAYEQTFPHSLNYWFEHQGWQFIGLDSSEGARLQTSVQPVGLRWLEETLPKLDKKRPTVVFTHFPFGHLVIYRVRNADEVLGRFKEHNLRAIFSGHFHSLTEREASGVMMTTNRCCSFHRKNHDGVKEKGYFLCRARNGRLERTFIEFQKA